MTSPQEDRQRLTRRALLVGGVKALAFGGLAARLYQLQVLEGDRFQTLAEENRINVKFHAPKRGVILDRFGQPLALNRRTYRVLVTPEAARDLEAALDRLDRIVPISPEERTRILRQAKRNPGFVAVATHEHLDWEAIARISAHIPELPGVEVEQISQRLYPQAAAAAHPIGYVGPVSKRDLTGDPVLSLPDLRIGKAGVERIYDLALRGEAGQSRVEVNAVGRVVRELERDQGVSGDVLVSTLDLELQRFAFNRMGEETGAAVVMDVHNGDVLTMTSNPSYDPNLFTQGIAVDMWKALSTDPLGPLTNKAVSGQYAPGSTFKMLVALAALEHGIVNSKKQFFCSGVHKVGRGRFHCWRRHGHGWMDLHEAIEQSCDIYFYEIARKVGIDRIAEMARRFGLGSRTGIDLPTEARGLMPTKAWKQKRLKQPWQIGETLIAGIGQGFVLTTPLQLAVMTARIVNGGKAVSPRLLRKQGESDAAPEFESVGVAKGHLALVQKAMQAVTTSGNGTARGSQLPVRAYRMGGKTGTSQVRRISRDERRKGVLKNEELPREARDHSLFVGFAPLNKPRYACAVIVEHGGSGSKVAAPMARDVLMEAQSRKSAEWRPGVAAADAGPSAGKTRKERG